MWRNHLLPASLYDVPAIQAWLEDQAKRGKLLEYWCAFRKGEPTDCKYRLEPAAEEEYKPSAEKTEAYAEAGWEFVCVTFGDPGEFFIWRSTRTDAEELYTEPESESIRYDWAQKRWWCRGGWLWAGFAVVPLRLSGILSVPVRALGWKEGFCHPVVLGQMFLLALFIAAGIWRVSTDQRALRRLRDSLRSGVPMPHRGAYGYLRWINLVLVVLLLLNLAMPFLLLEEYTALQEIAVLNRWKELGWI